MSEQDKKCNANVAHYLAIAARESPTQCAVKIPNGRDEGGYILYDSLNFSQLYEQSSAVTLWLANQGITRGSRVLVMVKPGLELIEVTFALFMLGAVPVVIDPGMGIKNFLQCVKRSRPDFLVGIPLAIKMSQLFFIKFWSLKKRISITGKNMSAALLKYESSTVSCVHSAADDLAAILFTSGSTGAPKGVCYEHGMFDAQVKLIRNQYDIKPGEVDLPMLPIFALFNPALGMTTVVPEMDPSCPAKVDAKKLVQAIHQNKVTSSFGSPILWTKIGHYCNKYNVTLPSLKRVLMAGAPVAPKLMWLYKTVTPNASIHSPYGATESLPVTSISSVEVLDDTWSQTESGKGTCVGRPLPDMQVKVIAIDSEPIQSIEFTKPLDNDEIGEIIVKGPVVTKAYDALPDATTKAKIIDGNGIWHRMGDAGYMDKMGRLWFCGRIAERVVLDDTVLFTDQVEPLFNAHNWVYRSALVGVQKNKNMYAVIAIQPTPAHWPKSTIEKRRFKSELGYIAGNHGLTEIHDFVFLKKFPVDVRHNAKIHRLEIGKMLSSKK